MSKVLSKEHRSYSHILWLNWAVTIKQILKENLKLQNKVYFSNIDYFTIKIKYKE